MLRNKPPVRRSPQGVLSSKPVYMRLMPDERRALEELSTSQNRSTSSVARLVYLQGVDRYKDKVSESAPQPHSIVGVHCECARRGYGECSPERSVACES
jgi:hypothetical protein